MRGGALRWYVKCSAGHYLVGAWTLVTDQRRCPTPKHWLALGTELCCCWLAYLDGGAPGVATAHSASRQQ